MQMGSKIQWYLPCPKVHLWKNVHIRCIRPEVFPQAAERQTDMWKVKHNHFDRDNQQQ